MVFVGRKGYFFVIDAAIAAIVLLFGIMYLFSASVSAPTYGQTYTITEDFASVLLYTQLSRVTNSYYTGTLLPANAVPYADATPLEQIGYLYYEDYVLYPAYRDFASNFTESLVNESLEARYGSAIYINNTLIYQRGIPKETIVINRSIVLYVRMNETYLLGPMRGDVLVWY